MYVDKYKVFVYEVTKNSEVFRHFHIFRCTFANTVFVHEVRNKWQTFQILKQIKPLFLR